MSRVGRGRGGAVALPLDAKLFRENTNCPSAARSAGTVGKWGITSFTSIRSAPYAFANNTVKKPVQDQNKPLTVPALEPELAPPKPKKFFKSRNAPEVLPAGMPQPVFAPPVTARSPSPEYLPGPTRRESAKSHSKKSKAKSPAAQRDSSPDVPKPKYHKQKPPTKAARKEEPQSEAAHLSPNKRYLVRNRAKINYAEDRSNSPIPDLSTSYSNAMPSVSSVSPAKVSTPKSSPPVPTPSVSSPTYVKPGLLSPSNKDGKPPPIVLRISKGTSRIVSTDSNEGLTSPSSDRHSSADTHAPDLDPKMSPPLEAICSPKHESLKITIKCSGLTKEEKSSKKKEKKEKGEDKESSRSRAHKRNHRKSSDDEPLIKKVTSPLPGTENYDLYRTLASPESEKVDVDKSIKESKKEKTFEDIESELAMLDSAEPIVKSPRISPQQSIEPAPDPKPPEKLSRRAMRNRANINYNENDDTLIDDVTATRLSRHTAKVLKKSKKKSEGAPVENSNSSASNPEVGSDNVPEQESNEEILSGGEGANTASDSLQLKINKKHCQKNVQIEQLSPHPEENNCSAESPERNDSKELSPESHVFKSPRQMEGVPASEDKPSVKLVITKKKGSIFKSKSLVNDSTASPLPARKRRHLYKHQWDDDGKGNQTPRREAETPVEVPNPTNPVPEELSRVTRYRAPEPTMGLPDTDDEVQPYTSVRCPKGAKEYYTVVRNVKKAHQIQEIGEFQEFNDDVEYILDALQDNNPMSTRCLSAITLASKCTAPAFRMHVRAHGTVQKFFSALHDATNDQSLGLCTATVMFVLSQDRLNMDLDRESLELMLNLLESDVSHRNALDDCGLTSAQLLKNRERVRELCAEIKSQGKATHLDLDNITVGHLAMETLLSLTSKRAGEWFKEELRVLGGVDHIVRTIRDCVTRLIEVDPTNWTPAHVDTLRKADRCMRVLENVTQQNEENQLYLVSERDGRPSSGVAQTLAILLRLCCSEARRNPPHPSHLHAALLEAALPAIKVLINLSHSFTPSSFLGSSVVGENLTVMETSLIILHNEGNFVPESKNFEFSVCLLLLLINLVQNNPDNVARLLKVSIRVDGDGDGDGHAPPCRKPALDLLVDHFYRREELAKLAEENTDRILDGKEKEKEDEATEKKKQSQDEFVEETVAKLLAKAGVHMEHSIMGAYIVLLLGHMASLSPALDDTVRERTHTRDYSLMLPALRKYYSFLNLTASAEAASVAHVKATLKIIEFLAGSDRRHSGEDAPAPASAHVDPDRRSSAASPSDMPRDMSLSNLEASYHSIDYSTSGSDRINSSIEMSF